MIYLDGSALCRFLPGVRHYDVFAEWARDHADELVTTQLGFTELRQAAELYPRSAADRVAGIVDLVRAGVAVIRFSDDNVAISSHATAVLKPFAALHVGAAVAHEQVDTIVTYDPALANVARIYELAVVSPGLPDGWFHEYQGPPEHWKPVALDAPYEPGAEFDVPEVVPKPDAYEIALEEAQREAAAKASLEEAAGVESPESEPLADESASSGTDHSDRVSDVAQVPEEVSELERALREAEAAAAAGDSGGERELGGAPGDDRDAPVTDGTRDAEGAARRPGTDTTGASAPSAPPARPGTYRPRIEAWHEGDPEEDRPRLEVDGTQAAPEAEVQSAEPMASQASGVGSGLPWSAPSGSTPRSGAPAPLPRDVLMGPPPAPTQEAPAPHAPAPPASTPEAPPALAPPAPIEPVAIPNLPREERGVPPVAAPTRESIGPAVRRPIFETNPAADSRASRPPEPVPPVPPEESSPLTVPIKWNVELDEPEAYAPLRFASDAARALPSLPVSFAGGQGGLTIESGGDVSVPALEPTAPAFGGARDDDARSPLATPGASSPMSARERKAAEKAAKKDRERRDKAAKKSKGAAAAPPPEPTPIQPPSAGPQAVPPVAPKPASPAASPAGSEGWKLDDIVDFKPKKRGS